MDAHKPVRGAGMEWLPTDGGRPGMPQRFPEQSEVHVWRWEIPSGVTYLGESDLAAEIVVLDEEERARLSRFKAPAVARQFALSHAKMRRILGGYLGIAAEELRFVAGEQGKPELAVRGERLEFNLSHTQGVGLLAVSREAVGVDVERMRPMEKAVAETHFSERERGELAQLEGEEWLLGFYRCWTRKEAIVKAEGVGVGNRLARFDVSLLPGEPAAMLATRVEGMRQWHLHELRPTEGTIATLAVGERDVKVRGFAT